MPGVFAAGDVALGVDQAARISGRRRHRRAADDAAPAGGAPGKGRGPGRRLSRPRSVTGDYRANPSDIPEFNDFRHRWMMTAIRSTGGCVPARPAFGGSGTCLVCASRLVSLGDRWSRVPARRARAARRRHALGRIRQRGCADARRQAAERDERVRRHSPAALRGSSSRSAAGISSRCAPPASPNIVTKAKPAAERPDAHGQRRQGLQRCGRAVAGLARQAQTHRHRRQVVPKMPVAVEERHLGPAARAHQRHPGLQQGPTSSDRRWSRRCRSRPPRGCCCPTSRSRS